MYHSLPFADRRQRQDSRPERHHSRGVLVGEKEFFNPADPADHREYRIVLGYGRR